MENHSEGKAKRILEIYIWEQSVEFADEQFKSLPINKRFNGFYLQELMHCYAEKLKDSIIDKED